MTNEEVCNTLGAKFYEKLPVKHDVINFLDDINSVITAEPGVNIENYINQYFKLLEIYYNSKKLKINTDKTQLLLCSVPRFINQIEDMDPNTRRHPKCKTSRTNKNPWVPSQW